MVLLPLILLLGFRLTLGGAAYWTNGCDENGSGLYLYMPESSISWDDAAAACEARGGSLATFADLADLQARDYFAGHHGSATQLLVGYNDKQIEGLWVDMSGEEFGSMTSETEGSDCAAITISDGSLSEIECATAATYAYYCYVTMFISDVGLQDTWATARTTCTDQNAVLVFPRNRHEAGFIRGKTGTDDFWVDWTDAAAQDTWINTHGDQIGATNDFLWRDDEPSGDGHCMMISPDLTLAMDADCADNAYFACGATGAVTNGSDFTDFTSAATACAASAISAPRTLAHRDEVVAAVGADTDGYWAAPIAPDIDGIWAGRTDATVAGYWMGGDPYGMFANPWLSTAHDADSATHDCAIVTRASSGIYGLDDVDCAASKKFICQKTPPQQPVFEALMLTKTTVALQGTAADRDVGDSLVTFENTMTRLDVDAGTEDTITLSGSSLSGDLTSTGTKLFKDDSVEPSKHYRYTITVQHQTDKCPAKTRVDVCTPPPQPEDCVGEVFETREGFGLLVSCTLVNSPTIKYDIKLSNDADFTEDVILPYFLGGLNPLSSYTAVIRTREVSACDGATDLTSALTYTDPVRLPPDQPTLDVTADPALDSVSFTAASTASGNLQYHINHWKGECDTTDGDPCLFPFLYRGVMFYECPYAGFCATERDETTLEMTAKGTCSDECSTVCSTTSGNQCVFDVTYEGTLFSTCGADSSVSSIDASGSCVVGSATDTGLLFLENEGQCASADSGVYTAGDATVLSGGLGEAECLEACAAVDDVTACMWEDGVDCSYFTVPIARASPATGFKCWTVGPAQDETHFVQDITDNVTPADGDSGPWKVFDGGTSAGECFQGSTGTSANAYVTITLTHRMAVYGLDVTTSNTNPEHLDSAVVSVCDGSYCVDCATVGTSLSAATVLEVRCTEVTFGDSISISSASPDLGFCELRLIAGVQIMAGYSASVSADASDPVISKAFDLSNGVDTANGVCHMTLDSTPVDIDIYLDGIYIVDTLHILLRDSNADRFAGLVVEVCNGNVLDTRTCGPCGTVPDVTSHVGTWYSLACERGVLGSVVHIYRDSSLAVEPCEFAVRAIPAGGSTGSCEASTNCQATATSRFGEVTGLDPGTRYFLQTQTTFSGLASARSAVVASCTKPALPIFNASPNETTTENITMCWEEPSSGGWSGFEFLPDGSSAATDVADELCYNMTGGQPGTCYTLQVRAYLNCSGVDAGAMTVVTGDYASTTQCTRPEAPLLEANGMSSSRIRVDLTPAGGGAQYESHSIETSANDGATWTELTTDEGISVESLDPGSTHWFRATSTLNGVQSDFSNVTIACTLPEVPATFTADACSGTSVDVTWPACSGTCDGYRVRQGVSGAWVDKGTATTHSFTELAETTSYTFYLKAYFDCEGTILDSAMRTVAASTSPPTPTVSSASSAETGSVTLTFTNFDSRYTVSVERDGVSLVSAYTDDSYVDTEADPGTEFTYTVWYSVSGSDCPDGPEVDVVECTAPEGITGTGYTSTDTQIVYTWTGPATAISGYKYWSGESGSPTDKDDAATVTLGSLQPARSHTLNIQPYLTCAGGSHQVLGPTVAVGGRTKPSAPTLTGEALDEDSAQFVISSDHNLVTFTLHNSDSGVVQTDISDNPAYITLNGVSTGEFWAVAHFHDEDSAESSPRVTLCYFPDPVTNGAAEPVGTDSFTITFDEVSEGTVVATLAGSARTASGTSSVSFSSLEPCTLYNVVLRVEVTSACDSSVTLTSDPVELLVRTFPETPAITRVVGVSSTEIQLQFEYQSTLEYQVYRDGEYIGDATTRTFSDPGLTQASFHEYTILASCHGLSSDESAALGTCSQPGPITHFNYTQPGKFYAILEWEYPASNVEGYTTVPKTNHQARSCQDNILEVFDGSSWGAVCDAGFDTNDADVACVTLGFSGHQSFAPAASLAAQSTSHLTNLGCTGSEASLFDCTHDGWGSASCSSGNFVQLICASDNPVTLDCETEADNPETDTTHGVFGHVPMGSSWFRVWTEFTCPASTGDVVMKSATQSLLVFWGTDTQINSTGRGAQTYQIDVSPKSAQMSFTFKSDVQGEVATVDWLQLPYNFPFATCASAECIDVETSFNQFASDSTNGPLCECSRPCEVTGLTATPQSSDAILLTWSEDDHGDATGYEVKFSEGDWIDVHEELLYNVTGLESAQQYLLEVRRYFDCPHGERQNSSTTFLSAGTGPQRGRVTNMTSINLRDEPMRIEITFEPGGGDDHNDLRFTLWCRSVDTNNHLSDWYQVATDLTVSDTPFIYDNLDNSYMYQCTVSTHINGLTADNFDEFEFACSRPASPYGVVQVDYSGHYVKFEWSHEKPFYEDHPTIPDYHNQACFQVWYDDEDPVDVSFRREANFTGLADTLTAYLVNVQAYERCAMIASTDSDFGAQFTAYRYCYDHSPLPAEVQHKNFVYSDYDEVSAWTGPSSPNTPVVDINEECTGTAAVTYEVFTVENGVVYDLVRSGTVVQPDTISGFYEDTGLSAGGIFEYRMRAYFDVPNYDNLRLFSYSGKALGCTCPPPPLSITFEALSPSSIQVTWVDPFQRPWYDPQYCNPDPWRQTTCVPESVFWFTMKHNLTTSFDKTTTRWTQTVTGLDEPSSCNLFEIHSNLNCGTGDVLTSFDPRADIGCTQPYPLAVDEPLTRAVTTDMIEFCVELNGNSDVDVDRINMFFNISGFHQNFATLRDTSLLCQNRTVELPGTPYQFNAHITKYGVTSDLMSPWYQLCALPYPPQRLQALPYSDTELEIIWRPPRIGGYTRYLYALEDDASVTLPDGQHFNLRGDLVPGARYTFNVTLINVFDCPRTNGDDPVRSAPYTSLVSSCTYPSAPLVEVITDCDECDVRSVLLNITQLTGLFEYHVLTIDPPVFDPIHGLIGDSWNQSLPVLRTGQVFIQNLDKFRLYTFNVRAVSCGDLMGLIGYRVFRYEQPARVNRIFGMEPVSATLVAIAIGLTLTAVAYLVLYLLAKWYFRPRPPPVVQPKPVDPPPNWRINDRYEKLADYNYMKYHAGNN